MTRREQLVEALGVFDLSDVADVEELGEIICDHLQEGMIHALLRGLSKVESEVGTPAVARALLEAAERIERLEKIGGLNDDDESALAEMNSVVEAGK